MSIAGMRTVRGAPGSAWQPRCAWSPCACRPAAPSSACPAPPSPLPPASSAGPPASPPDQARPPLCRSCTAALHHKHCTPALSCSRQSSLPQPQICFCPLPPWECHTTGKSLAWEAARPGLLRGLEWARGEQRQPTGPLASQQEPLEEWTPAAGLSLLPDCSEQRPGLPRPAGLLNFVNSSGQQIRTAIKPVPTKGHRQVEGY